MFFWQVTAFYYAAGHKLIFPRFVTLLQMRFYRAAAVILFLQGTQSFACAFHEFPPFGADWYHESIYRILYNNSMQRDIGVSYALSNYSRTFLPEPEFPGETTKPVLLKEQMAHRSFYYKFRISERLTCLASVIMTDIRAQALADDGPVAIGSSSAGQLSAFLSYALPLMNKNQKNLQIKITGGIQSTLFAENVFYSKYGWLKYQWNKVSPHLVAGAYKNAATFAVTPVYMCKAMSLYSGASVRFFTFNKDGFKYGTDFNLFFTAGYRIPLRMKDLRAELIGGIVLEKGLQDTKKTFCAKDEDTYANGSVFSVTTGVRVSYKNIGFGYSGFRFFDHVGFTEFQLYHKLRNTFFIQVSF